MALLIWSSKASYVFKRLRVVRSQTNKTRTKLEQASFAYLYVSEMYPPLRAINVTMNVKKPQTTWAKIISISGFIRC